MWNKESRFSKCLPLVVLWTVIVILVAALSLKPKIQPAGTPAENPAVVTTTATVYEKHSYLDKIGSGARVFVEVQK